MSTYTEQKKTKVTTRRLMEMKQRGEKIACLTSYDFTIASLVDEAGVDLILVGDSASNVMAGNLTTLPITLDEMITYAKGVTRAAKRALVVVDLPFGTYQGNSMEALASAVRVMKEAGAEAVKLEGGSEIRESIERILTAGIPVMGHLGLTPQSINKFAPRRRPRPASLRRTPGCSTSSAASPLCLRRCRRSWRRGWRRW